MILLPIVPESNPTLTLLDFLPESIAADPEVIALSHAIDPELRAVSAAAIEANILPRLDQQPEAVIDALGWGFDLVTLAAWGLATPEGKQRILSSIFDIRRRSGTVYAARRCFDLLQLGATFIEWFEEAADPFTYRLSLDASEIGISAEALAAIPELLRRFTPTRSSLTDIQVTAEIAGLPQIYPALIIGRHTTIPFGG